MEQLVDGQHVALQSAFYGTYIYADEDGRGVSLHPRRSSPNAAWVVHLLLDGGSPHVLLYGVSYGSYLAATTMPAPSGLRGSLVRQHCFDRPEDQSVRWEPVRAGSGDVLLRSLSGGYLRASDTVATVHDNDRCGWWRPSPREISCRGFQILRAHLSAKGRAPFKLQPPWRREPRADIGHIARAIRFVRAERESPDGTFPHVAWACFEFTGRSLFNLRIELARRLNFAVVSDVIICVRAGFFGRLTPLVTDLPPNNVIMEIIVVTAGTIAANELRFPNVGAV
uniref:Uncharacterized protein n=1 Tax=Oryza punctata TaxID=4537 RepID=A0A0E0L879_ORYPU